MNIFFDEIAFLYFTGNIKYEKFRFSACKFKFVQNFM